MSRADSPLRDRMIFNVGARRSGTLWLQRIITAHPEVAAVPSETHLLSHGVAPLLDRFQHSLRSSELVARVYAEREPILDAVRDVCDTAFAPFLEEGATRLAERTPLHALHLDLVSELYPDARVVHIIRDGRDVARSIVAQRWPRGPHTIEAAAEEWRDTVRTARSAAAQGLGPERYREVRYEALLAEPRDEIEALLEWLGLSATGEALEAALDEARRPANVGGSRSGIGAGKWAGELSPEDLAAVERVAGELLAELGYTSAATGAPKRARESLASRLRAGRRSSLERLRRPREQTGDGVRAWERGPGRPRSARVSVGAVGAGVGRALDGLRWRRARPASGSRPATPRLQALVDDVVGALQRRDPDALLALMTPRALVRVVGADGAEEGRGERARALLARTLAADAALSGRQVRGDPYPSLPTYGVVLAFRARDGSLSYRLLFLRISGEAISELTLYPVPAGSDGP